MLPVVAIVGRPNVGKSTLFNCFTRTRDALISPIPGTTRDRQYGEVDLMHRRFIVIDTGGFLDEANDMGGLITQQAHQAIEEADKVIFLIDGRTGITPDDKWIADLLRRSNKPLILAVNKTEGLDPDISIADAHELGLGLPIPIASAHRYGIENLIESLFPEPSNFQPKEEELKVCKFAIVGRPNVGKSTLANRMLGEERVIVHDTPGTTRDSIYVPLKRHDKDYILIDTAGVRKRKKVSEIPEKFSIVKTLQSVEDANVVLYVVDARLGVSEQDLKLIGFVLECGKGLVIAINKWDGMTEDARNDAKNSIDRHLDFVTFARIHYISALHGSGVGNLFNSIDEAYESALKRFPTPVLTRLLQEAVATHQPPLIHGRRVKLRYAHAGGHNPPRIIIHGNQVKSLPESYRKFLEHFYQTKLQLYGTPVAIEFREGKNPYRK